MLYQKLSDYIDIRDSLKIRLGSARKMGRGVFATDFIPAYSEIVRCHCLVLTKKDLEEIEKTSISKHYFQHTTKKDMGLLALGIITMINHSPKPNVEVFLQKINGHYVAICQCISDINKGKQLFMNYGPDVTF